MLVTLLTLVALSVLLLQHIRYLQAVTEVARVKADFAAQSGVAHAATERTFTEQGDLLRFADSSSAFLRTLPWGLMKACNGSGYIGQNQVDADSFAWSGSACGIQERHLLWRRFTPIDYDGLNTNCRGYCGWSHGDYRWHTPGEKQPPHLPVAGKCLAEIRQSVTLRGQAHAGDFICFVCVISERFFRHPLRSQGFFGARPRDHRAP